MKILVTGAAGFIGRNLVARLATDPGIELVTYGRHDPGQKLEIALGGADAVYHLAGVNRPANVDEFAAVNFGLTERICSTLRQLNRRPLIVYASSSQAELDNPYGQSKRRAEEALREFGEWSDRGIVAYRLRNVFGKWSRPNYNSVVATFCHNVARGLPINVADADRVLPLTYVDDVVDALRLCLKQPAERFEYRVVSPIYEVSVGRLAELIRSFAESRSSLVLPEFADPFIRKLYATYVSCLDPAQFGYCLQQRHDPRGVLAEFIKQPHFGQMFVSRTRPGITRGNHYHHTKVEKFLVVSGEALIRFRMIDGTEVIDLPVRGDEFKVVDIPPGYTHSITNSGESELIVLFWASEVFDPARPDTNALPVVAEHAP